jgi:hypothetical protein
MHDGVRDRDGEHDNLARLTVHDRRAADEPLGVTSAAGEGVTPGDPVAALDRFGGAADAAATGRRGDPAVPEHRPHAFLR